MFKNMYITDELRRELDYFQRMNEHFTINAGKSTCKIADASDEILYMAMSASLAMDYSEDGFFEEFKITDKSISGNNEKLVDAYAFIETESTNIKHLHIFQFKLHASENSSVSPKELLQFSTLINNVFVHPELRGETDLEEDKVLSEIDQLVQAFLLERKTRKIVVHCHFINNAKGVSKSNEAAIQGVMGRFEYDKQHRNFKVQVYGLQDIIELAVDGKIKVNSETIEFLVDGPDAYRYEDNSLKSGIGLPRKVFIGICNVNEFIGLQNKYHHNQLYSENIRLYLGDRAAVNKDIINTITSDSSIWFPYMNNGISIICDEFDLGNVKKNGKVNIEIKNMQIINGCQTINALYSAKYNEQTKDDFRASNVLVRIYHISPEHQDFKLSVIRATNNQNAVKTYSLLANDPIQIKIEEVLNKFDYLYDRKGEAKLRKSEKVVSMPNGALAYRAVFWFAAQSLRSRIGQSRVFQKSEYEKLYKNEALEDKLKLYRISSKLLLSTILLDTTRDLIQDKTNDYIVNLPIFKKSAYYLVGFIYAKNKYEFDKKIDEMVNLLNADNIPEIKGRNIPASIIQYTKDAFDEAVLLFIDFYNKSKVDKSDIDNLLKSPVFAKEYKIKVEELMGEEIPEEEYL